MPRFFFPILLLTGIFLPSCSNTSKAPPANTEPQGATIKSLYDSGYDGGYKIVQDPETGFSKAVSTKESDPFPNKKNKYFSGDNNSLGKTYNTSQYDAKRWQEPKKKLNWLPWNRAKDEYQNSPEFVRKNANYGSKTANERTQGYASKTYNTKYSTEQSSAPISKVVDYQTQRKNQQYEQPEIIKNEGQSNSGLSVSEVKRILK